MIEFWFPISTSKGRHTARRKNSHHPRPEDPEITRFHGLCHPVSRAPMEFCRGFPETEKFASKTAKAKKRREEKEEENQEEREKEKGKSFLRFRTSKVQISFLIAWVLNVFTSRGEVQFEQFFFWLVYYASFSFLIGRFQSPRLSRANLRESELIGRFSRNGGWVGSLGRTTD